MADVPIGSDGQHRWASVIVGINELPAALAKLTGMGFDIRFVIPTPTQGTLANQVIMAFLIIGYQYETKTIDKEVLVSGAP